MISLLKKALDFGYEVSFRTLDKGFFEILGPYGISHTFQKLSRQMSRIQSGFVYHYALLMLIGLTVFIAIVGLWDFFSFWIDNRLYFLIFISFIFYHVFCDGQQRSLSGSAKIGDIAH